MSMFGGGLSRTNDLMNSKSKMMTASPINGFQSKYNANNNSGSENTNLTDITNYS